MPDIFGDLREWGRVLDQLARVTSAGRLDQHEEGLTRLLRYRYNWQIRQAAIHAVPKLDRPSKEVIDVLIRIVTDEFCDLETRILACDAVRESIHRRRLLSDSSEFEAEAARQASEILRTPQPPALRKAVEQWLIHQRVETAVGA